MILHKVSLLLFSSFLLLLHAQNPESTITRFQHLPSQLFFFDDSEAALYHDGIEGDVFVSQNEGKSWSLVDGVPRGDAAIVIDHPFDNRYAFILTRGTTHYRTEDRGKTWRSFDMPVPPALVSRPLSFHSNPQKYGHILYQGTSCERFEFGDVCNDETYYTTDAFGRESSLLLTDTTSCQFAHSSVDFKHDAQPHLIYCVAFGSSTVDGRHAISSSRLFSSTDFFNDDISVEDLGIGKSARGVVAFAIVSKFAVVALKDENGGDMSLYVSLDTLTWARAHFPHASTARLRENAYTIVESTTHSLAVDVVLQEQGSVGTLFVSNSNGTFFVESLKDTNRNDFGYVDYENLYGVEGVGLANVVANAEEVDGRGATKQLKTKITFDDGSSWSPLLPPSTDNQGNRIGCNPADVEHCSLHLHSVTSPHNFGRVFSSPAPGFVMGVGSIGESLRPYEESDTFFSQDAGITWTMTNRDAHKYEFGDQGSIIVAINDEEYVDTVSFSTDEGKSWAQYNIGIKLRAKILTTIRDSTSQKFLLSGQVSRSDTTDEGRYVVVFLDFAPTRRRQCTESDFEKWYARSTHSKECLMGHKQWYRRRKQDADCYVGQKFRDPVVHEDSCPCQEEDFECDYNFVRNGAQCDPVGPEPIPAGVCNSPDQMYKGSSGWRKIPGNTCQGGLSRDDKIDKKCSEAQPAEGAVIHQTYEFGAGIVQHEYFKDSQTILMRLADGTVWQSSNEGFTWKELFPGERFLVFYLHSYTSDRAYLITDSKKYYYTTDTGRQWVQTEAPTTPNTFGAQILHFHPQSDYLIWTGNEHCDGSESECHAKASYSRNHGRKWTDVESYVRNCAWARDAELRIDPNQILCESYLVKQGNQRAFLSNDANNPLQLIGGTHFFAKKNKLFDHVVGFAKFSEFLIVAEYVPQRMALDLQVSLDGRTFASGMFPPSMHPDTHAYTILESSTMAVFLHVTMSESPRPYWGNILKSNSNGTYFGVSVENVNRDERGYVDFEKMIGLDGIALVNVVSNTEDAVITKDKVLQTLITHNDGSTWKPLVPPPVDSFGRQYDCDTTNCALHVHGYTERYDTRATYSSPSVVGLIMAVGNVGEYLAPYAESDTFLSRDAGFTWEEVHKDAHLWEFGDSGSILVMANDEEPTDHVLFSTNEGIKWREYRFTDEKIRVKNIITVPSDTSRRFILIGNYPRSSASVVVHLDFSTLTLKKCTLSVEDPGHDDFELWSPSEERAELCLFGRQTLYHRRVRTAECIVGKQKKLDERVVHNCPCAKVDFECEFNYVKNANDECVLVPGTMPRPSDDSCRNGEEYWYERTAYRKIPFSTCEDGIRPDRGPAHLCPGISGHGVFFWLFVLVLPFVFTALVAYWFYRRSGLARGNIRLPGDVGSASYGRGGSGVLATLASVPWFLVGIAGIAWESVSSSFETLSDEFRSRRGYRDLPVDEDAQILRFEDEE